MKIPIDQFRPDTRKEGDRDDSPRNEYSHFSDMTLLGTLYSLRFAVTANGPGERTDQIEHVLLVELAARGIDPEINPFQYHAGSWQGDEERRARGI